VNIIACVKQVPDTETQIRIAPDGKSIVTEGIKWVVRVNIFTKDTSSTFS